VRISKTHFVNTHPRPFCPIAVFVLLGLPFQCCILFGFELNCADMASGICAVGRTFNLVTAISFILPSNWNTKYEFECTKNLRRTEYLFAIYQMSQI